MTVLTTAAALLYAIFLGLFFYLPSSRSIPMWIALLDLVFVVIGALQYWSAAARASAKVDKIWYRLSVGFLIWCIAIVLRVFEMALKQPGYGTLADAFWISGYLPLLSGSQLWFRYSEPSKTKQYVILIVLALIAVLVLVFLERPLLMDPDRPAVLKALDLMYASFDLLMIGLLAAPATRRNEWGCRFLMLSLTLLLISDIVFSYFGEKPSNWIYSFLDLPYTTGYFLIALSAGMQRRRIHDREPAAV